MQKQHKYDIKQDDHDVEEFNSAIKDAIGGSTCTIGSLQQCMGDAAHSCLNQPAPKTKKPWIKPATLELIHQKHEIMKAGSAEDKKHICKQVKKQCKQDWIEWAELSISNELDLRDKWLGIRNMKTKRAPQVFERNNRHGKPVSLGLQAEATADYLE